MSFMRFLYVDRSFIGAQDRVGRYRMKPEHRLPTFGRGPMADVVIRVGKLEKITRRKPSMLGWLFNVLGIRSRGSEPQAKANRPQFGATGVEGMAEPLTQAELGLQQLQVVRNDLSDSDIEVKSQGRGRQRTRGLRAEWIHAKWPKQSPQVEGVNCLKSLLQWSTHERVELGTFGAKFCPQASVVTGSDGGASAKDWRHLRRWHGGRRWTCGGDAGCKRP